MAVEEKKVKASKSTKAASAKPARVAKVKAEKPEKLKKVVAVAAKSDAKVDANYGKDMSTAGFAISVASIFINFFTLGLLAIVGLVLSIIGRVQTSKAGNPSGMALAGIIISSIVIALSTLAFLFFAFVAIIAGPDSRFWHEETSPSMEIDCDHPRHRMSDECRQGNGQEPLFDLQPNSL